MKISEVGLQVIKDSEGLRLRVYKDPGPKGYPTIGWGHMLKPGESFPNGITVEQAEELLRKDVRWAEEVVHLNVDVPLTQSQFDALVSFVFNVGPGVKGEKDGFVTLRSGGPSTMLRKLNAGDYQGAADEFPKWVRAGGIVLAGLQTRRGKERRLFLLDQPAKKLSKSKTIAGAIATTPVIAGGVVDAARQYLPEAATAAKTVSAILPDWSVTVFAAVALAGLCLVIYSRWDDRNKGKV